MKQRLQEVKHALATVRCMPLFAGTHYENNGPPSWVASNYFEV